MSIQGLLVVKPQNVPTVGAVKTFTVNGDRVKVTPPDKGGQPYRIMSATQSATYKDAYGNIGYNVELDADPTAQPTPPQSTQAPRGNVNGGNWGEERSQRIERQHSQEMALRYCTLNNLTVAKEPDSSGKEITRDQFVALVSWFQRDIGRPPIADQAKEMFNATEPEPDEIPFGPIPGDHNE